MRNEDGSRTGDADSDTDSMSTDRSAFSGPLVPPREASNKSPQLPPPEATPRLGGSSADGDDGAVNYIEITLDIRDDSVLAYKVKPTWNDTFDDPELELIMRRRIPEEKSSPSVFGNTSSHHQEIRPQRRSRKKNSAAHHALKGLNFIKNSGNSGWSQVETRFHHLTRNKTNPSLHRSFFPQCIGMNEGSEGFANMVFKALAQRRNISGDSINKEQLRDFWDQLTDESFDSRLQIFFDMLDKDSDGRISQEDVAEMICVSASANNLKNMSDDKAKEYAALIMEELDPDNLGYVMIMNLEILLLQPSESDQSVRISDRRFMSQVLSQELNRTQDTNPVYRWYHKTTSMYLSAVPVILYGSERLIRPFRSSSKPLRILKVALYPGDVLTLHMSKPNGFKYKSGQYIFVNCSAVSRFEWRPFYITSSPGDDYISVHIQTLISDWTWHLKTVFSAACQQALADYSQDQDPPSLPKIVIDGPYGAPAQDYKKYDVVLLVGIGIGAAPMVSIIKDILNNIKMNEGWWFSRTRKAYFYWVTREQGSFEWFKAIIDEVVEMDESRGIIELHNYCTSVYKKGDARSAIIKMIQSLHHAKTGVDVVSGTRVKTHFGNPNWRKVYKNIALHHPETRVGVFYCGTAPGLTKCLSNLAMDFSHKISTKFDFYKNNL